MAIQVGTGRCRAVRAMHGDKGSTEHFRVTGTEREWTVQGDAERYWAVQGSVGRRRAVKGGAEWRGA